MSIEPIELCAPNGRPILGTLERLSARCEILSIHRTASGAIEYEHLGGSEIFWDRMETVERVNPATGAEEVVFLDDEGHEWIESELVPAEFFEKTED